MNLDNINIFYLICGEDIQPDETDSSNDGEIKSDEQDNDDFTDLSKHEFESIE